MDIVALGELVVKPLTANSAQIHISNELALLYIHGSFYSFNVTDL